MNRLKTITGLALAAGTIALILPGSAQTARDSNGEAAVHECSVRASKFKNDTNETNQIVNYRACMGEHGHQ